MICFMTPKRVLHCRSLLTELSSKYLFLLDCLQHIVVSKWLVTSQVTLWQHVVAPIFLNNSFGLVRLLYSLGIYVTNYRMERGILGWEKVEQIDWIELQRACLVRLPNLPQRKCAAVLAKKKITRFSVSYAAVNYRDAKESAACQTMGSKSKQQWGPDY